MKLSTLSILLVSLGTAVLSPTQPAAAQPAAPTWNFITASEWKAYDQARQQFYMTGLMNQLIGLLAPGIRWTRCLSSGAPSLDVRAWVRSTVAAFIDADAARASMPAVRVTIEAIDNACKGKLLDPAQVSATDIILVSSIWPKLQTSAWLALARPHQLVYLAGAIDGQLSGPVGPIIARCFSSGPLSGARLATMYDLVVGWLETEGKRLETVGLRSIQDMSMVVSYSIQDTCR